MAEPLSAVVRGLWQGFPAAVRRPASVKELLSRRRLDGSLRQSWALVDVSFDVRAGEIVGLVGANGAGKSTLLRSLAGILPPARGEVLVRGRTVCLLELEAGFHPELTGRENAAVVGSLFGFSRAEVRRRMDEVAAFGELEAVLDHDVRTYSSGTRVRLAIALCLGLRPDLILIDEYLARADERFRDKCSARLGELRDSGTSVVLVSHEAQVLMGVCDRCMLLAEGRLTADGGVAEVLDAYLERPAPPAVP